MASKYITIVHSFPMQKSTGLLLVPFGMYYNQRLYKAKPGALLRICDTWRRIECKIKQSCVLKVASREFTFMRRLIYGENTWTQDLFKQWEAVCINEGVGKDGFDHENVLLLEVEVLNETNK